MNFKEIVEAMRGEIIKNTQEIVRIKSVENDAKEGMPFGEGVNEALEYALNLCDDIGLKTKNFDGYAGHADLGEGEEVVGILVHLDVVPEGDVNTWSYPPYEAHIHDGKIFGRGTIDDKGPAMAAIYAMKAIKESNISLNKKIRIIFGTNEESGWECMKHYLSKEKAPDMAFTPDAEYPVIYGEKGIITFDYEKNFKDACNCSVKIKSIKGGNRPNMVPDYCEALLYAKDEKVLSIKNAFDEFIKKNNYKIEMMVKDHRIIIKSYGISAHGSTPENGQNAISQLMEFLGEMNLSGCDVGDFIKFYKDKIGMAYYGESAGCELEDRDSGKLIFNVGIIDLNEEKVKLTVNIRYPITYTIEKVMNGIRETLEGSAITTNIIRHKKPIYLPKEHELVQKLMGVYKKITGNDAQPITIGGGTYARVMNNAVAFGPLFPGQEKTAHQKDEYISIEDLIKNTEIYAHALYELAK
ncbi:succinyl-diaminopimelate desuccinylase [Anaerovirgula multivorans]|uniref:Succinyl-diaminopimelate desuccinylase n=1 Tax=Anaerovirgula multivorans TaxID=312168 RepID=A0A239GEY8_9FIRM|nr:dipeptidase PepV [Anaerovirgula multivorans]SNS67699.1 succinyl-diaminopimelate desuccinylase [Anaerovirgula multivorans]